MSNYIQIPNSITELTKKSKHEEALVYAAIRSQIKDHTLKASKPQKELAEDLGASERTINNYVAELIDVGLLNKPEKKLGGSSNYPYNVYLFEELKKDYFVILPSFLNDKNIPPKLKGLLLFIKANCWKGTNFLQYNGITTDLAKILGVGKNLIRDYLEELKSKGYIRFIGKSLHIINENFPLFLNNDMDNMTYKIIYDYCLEHDRIPPIKDVDGKGKDENLCWIVGKFTNGYDKLRNALEERCKNLPEHPSLEYFCQALVNKTPTKINKTYQQIII